MWEERLVLFDKIVVMAGFERKGKTMPYTSDNGHMFSLLNKAGEIGIRLSKEEGKAFQDSYSTGPFKSHGANMRGYVLIPDQLLAQPEKVAELLKAGHSFVLSLEPK